MRDEDQSFELMIFHQEAKPPCPHPGKFWQILHQRQALRPTRHDELVKVVTQLEAAIKEIVNSGPKSVVAATDHQDFRITTANLGS